MRRAVVCEMRREDAMKPVHDAFDAWRAADRLARDMERQVQAAALASMEGLGFPPTEAARRNAKDLRERADELLANAMQAIGAGRKHTSGPIAESDDARRD